MEAFRLTISSRHLLQVAYRKCRLLSYIFFQLFFFFAFLIVTVKASLEAKTPQKTKTSLQIELHLCCCSCKVRPWPAWGLPLSSPLRPGGEITSLGRVQEAGLLQNGVSVLELFPLHDGGAQFRVFDVVLLAADQVGRHKVRRARAAHGRLHLVGRPAAALLVKLVVQAVVRDVDGGTRAKEAHREALVKDAQVALHQRLREARPAAAMDAVAERRVLPPYPRLLDRNVRCCRGGGRGVRGKATPSF
mmetsp:Transcript_12804/g.29086  ORF Transcript_12804/g.29086 Transcript_12804/m.29086 type:complete len:247 (+) Transcript_12804:1022-1762(+)